MPLFQNFCTTYTGNCAPFNQNLHAFHYKIEFVEKATGLDISYPLNGKFLSATFDLDDNFQIQLDNRFKDKYLK